MSKTQYGIDANGNATWTTKIQTRGAWDNTQASEWATDEATSEFPGSSIQILSVERTSSGRHTVTLRGTIAPKAR